MSHPQRAAVKLSNIDRSAAIKRLRSTDLQDLQLMGGRRSPKLQRQFVHLPCLQETDLKGISGVPQVNGLYGGRSCILAQLVGQSEL
ncbi:hypothetical protein TNCV_3794051 [Trichonephila clavipes]|nr:hypothetical protein TNCV_3794051 [Trichonephila clavipes]